jgi:CubicO group peptidase (beta-lactamase class C family)
MRTCEGLTEFCADARAAGGIFIGDFACEDSTLTLRNVLSMTANDLARFDIALTQGRLLSPESMRAMWTTGRSPSGEALPHGLGWFVVTRDGEPLDWHTGLWEGAYSALYLKAPAGISP